MFGTIGYLGTKGTRLDQQFIPNSVPPGAPESALPHNFIYETSNGDSIYHAAQLQLNRRFRSGLMAALRTSSRNRSTTRAPAGADRATRRWRRTGWIWRRSAALSSFDTRHNLTLQFQYSTGMGKAGGTLVNGWKGALLKDWTVATSLTCPLGEPVHRDRGRQPFASERHRGEQYGARRSHGPAGGSARACSFNTAAFSQPAAGQWGSCGKKHHPGARRCFR